MLHTLKSKVTKIIGSGLSFQRVLGAWFMWEIKLRRLMLHGGFVWVPGAAQTQRPNCVWRARFRAPGSSGTMVGFVRVISEMRLRVGTQKNLLRHDNAKAQSSPDVLA